MSNGQDLKIVLKNRNEIAHGVLTFAEAGKESIENLIKIKQSVVKYLREVLQNIGDYISQKEYRI